MQVLENLRTVSTVLPKRHGSEKCLEKPLKRFNKFQAAFRTGLKPRCE